MGSKKRVRKAGREAAAARERRAWAPLRLGVGGTLAATAFVAVLSTPWNGDTTRMQEIRQAEEAQRIINTREALIEEARGPRTYRPTVESPRDTHIDPDGSGGRYGD